MWLCPTRIIGYRGTAEPPPLLVDMPTAGGAEPPPLLKLRVPAAAREDQAQDAENEQGQANFLQAQRCTQIGQRR
jgi:hypothetical protein